MWYTFVYMLICAWSVTLGLCVCVRASVRAFNSLIVTVMCCVGFLSKWSHVSRAFLHTHVRGVQYMYKWTHYSINNSSYSFVLNQQQTELKTVRISAEHCAVWTVMSSHVQISEFKHWIFKGWYNNQSLEQAKAIRQFIWLFINSHPRTCKKIIYN